ncbi:MAG: DUF554 domain-containing protein [Chloroflexi bacterium]|nr:DUF554 domain-containing protein [Chloroflexota bacterium]
MTGTFIYIIAVILGTILGLFVGSKLPERMRDTILAVLGLFTLALGIQMFLETNNALIVLAALLIGAILGEWWRIEDRLENFGSHLRISFSRSLKNQDLSRFVEGFLTASILFCVGPIAILGSIQDGLTGDYSLLATKAVMDGFASLAFASTMGIGVAFSSLILLVFQGGLSLLATQVQGSVTPAMISEMSATGGVILVGIAISNILNIRKIRTGNFLPALILVPLFVFLLSLLG